MNEELQNALVEVINSATSAKDFILAEMPDVIYQLLVWKLWENGIKFILPIVLMGLVSGLIFQCYRKVGFDFARTDNTPWFAMSALATGLGIVSSLVFAGISIPALFELVQLIVAPKIYLIEYAAELVK